MAGAIVQYEYAKWFVPAGKYIRNTALYRVFSRYPHSSRGAYEAMRCPNCQADVKYRERSGHICAKCRREFALDPKDNHLKLHDLRFKDLHNQISQQGTLYYTADQLRHHAGRKVAREASKPLTRTGCMITSVVIAVILAIVFAQGGSIYMGLFIGVVALVGLLGIVYVRGDSVFKYSLPTGLDDFQRRILLRWQQIYGGLPPRMLTDEVRSSLRDDQPAPEQVGGVVACPQRDVLECLRANAVPVRLNIQLLPTREPFTPTQQAMLERLRREPDLPLLLLHDASPAGVLLHNTIIKSLGLQKNHRIVDLGLQPADAIEHKMMRLGAKPEPQMLAIIKRFVVSKNKPVPNPQTRRGPVLRENEFRWLERGFYTPILSVSPARLIRVVTQAAQRLNIAPPAVAAHDAASADPEERARAQAQAVGFMTWPSA
jgi:hypothetical protein